MLKINYDQPQGKLIKTSSRNSLSLSKDLIINIYKSDAEKDFLKRVQLNIPGEDDKRP